MSEEAEPRPDRSLWVWGGAFFLAFPVTYFLSTGPAYSLMQHGLVSQELYYEFVYGPLIDAISWMDPQWEHVGMACDWYVELWP